jgi:hypothetical protein
MSPNACLCWNEKTGLLCGYPGEAEIEEPTFTWTYSVFEEFTGEAITPSMYCIMASYIERNITKQQLYEIQGDDYCPGDLEESAVDYYFEIPIQERIEMHEECLKNLRVDRDRAEEKMYAFIAAHLTDECPFDPSSPIYIDYCQWTREGKNKWEEELNEMQNRVNEEELWTSGAEEGAENEAPLFDPMDE